VIEMIVMRRLEILDTTKEIDLLETSPEIGNVLVNGIITVSEIVNTIDATVEGKVDIVKGRQVPGHDALILLQDGITKTRWQSIQSMLVW
jgi:hypothetical protein